MVQVLFGRPCHIILCLINLEGESTCITKPQHVKCQNERAVSQEGSNIEEWFHTILWNLFAKYSKLGVITEQFDNLAETLL